MNIYTDGGCNPNPGIGKWAFVVLNPVGPKEPYIESGRVGSLEEPTTNNIMELMAIQHAIEYAAKSEAKHKWVIHSDSRYAIESIEGRFKGKKNKLLILEIKVALLRARSIVNIELKWVKGHSGIVGNELADLHASVD